jgi:hypothetical protein
MLSMVPWPVEMRRLFHQPQAVVRLAPPQGFCYKQSVMTFRCQLPSYALEGYSGRPHHSKLPLQQASGYQMGKNMAGLRSKLRGIAPYKGLTGHW